MITLVLGGTRSGKSITAETLARTFDQPVTYVATGTVDAADSDYGARIAAHKARRPDHWTTFECSAPSDLARILGEVTGVALVDSLGTWVTLHPDLVVDSAELLEALAHRDQPTVIVSEEVGLAVHPTTKAGRRYIDALGTLNQQIAQVSDRVLFVVAGRAIELPLLDAGSEAR